MSGDWLNHVVKIASRCNLNCSYCYVYNQADSSWRERPSLMSHETFDATVERIRRHCLNSGQDSVRLVFHGGEPTLVGAARFGAMCGRARARLAGVCRVEYAIQTNGTRLTPEWLAVLREHQVRIGISLDGPAEINDAARVDHRGRGSHRAVLMGIELLREEEIPFEILAVVPLGADPLTVHRHFLSLGAGSISYLLPSYTHDAIEPIRRRYGPTPCADFLIPVFDDWWENGSLDVSIRELVNLGKVLLGGVSGLDTIGNPPIRYVCIETDGSIQGLDKLRSCEDGMTDMGLNVHDADFAEIATASPFHAEVMAGLPLPTACRACPERETCAGGHAPNRYSRERGFDNPSVWCADLLALFGHVRERMGISHEETITRRARLESMRAAASESALV